MKKFFDSFVFVWFVLYRPLLYITAFTLPAYLFRGTSVNIGYPGYGEWNIVVGSIAVLIVWLFFNWNAAEKYAGPVIGLLIICLIGYVYGHNETKSEYEGRIAYCKDFTIQYVKGKNRDEANEIAHNRNERVSKKLNPEDCGAFIQVADETAACNSKEGCMPEGIERLEWMERKHLESKGKK